MSNSLFRRKTIDSILNDAQQSSGDAHGHGLKRVLSLRDLTFFGIAAIIGAGSFSALGPAIYNGGPGVSALFVLCGIACAFTALCYSDFASRIPVAGSAYTYAYASLGELAAWIIGWALLMEYAIGNVYVAFSWSDYLTSLLSRMHVHIPEYLTCSYSEAMGSSRPDLVMAWESAPRLLGLRVIFDLPALIINALVTWLVYIGIRESRNFSNVMVVMKLSIIALVLLITGFLIYKLGLTHNWTPPNAQGEHTFFPNRFSGVMKAVGGVFFAYIGFDAVSILAEESKNPQRDLPRGMILSLIICTVIYILLALALTGVVQYDRFMNVNDPLAFIFEEKNLNIGWMQFIVAVCAVVAMTSVMLVMQMGQPRIWMSMGRDGLMPSAFQKIHPKYKTPYIATLVTGLFVGSMIVLTNSRFVLDFTSTGTLFAFVLVCGGVLFLPRKEKGPGQFNMPYFNGKFLYPLLAIGAFCAFIAFDEGEHARHIPTVMFWLICGALAVLAFLKNLSMIPLMGLSSCLYLLTGIRDSNWKWFFIWFGIGLVIYAGYGYRNSRR
jgi:amino acid transporter